MGVTPAARQPRHDADRRAEPARLHLPLPRPARRAARRRSSARWRSPTSATAATPRSTSSRAACAGGCSSPARSCTSPRLVLLDEPTVGLDPQVRQELWALIDQLRSRGHVDPDVHALHRGGPAPGRHRDGHGQGPRGRDRAARPSSSPSTPAARRSRSTAPPARLREVEADARGGAAGPTRRTGTSVTILRAEDARRRGARRRAPRRPTSRTSSSCSPARRSL